MAGQTTVYYVSYGDATGSNCGGGGGGGGHLPQLPYPGPTAVNQCCPPAPPCLGINVPRVTLSAPPYPARSIHTKPPAPPYSGQNVGQACTRTPPYPGPSVTYGYGNIAPGAANAGPSRCASAQGATVVQSESRRQKWIIFWLGNLISAAVAISEIASLNVCFDKNLGDDDYTPEENAFNTHIFLMIALVFGLWVDVFSAIVLSVVYRSPLDIKSVHKIPPGDMRHCGAALMVNFLSPFSWALVYFWGALVSVLYGQNSPCGSGAEESGLGTYLVISGSAMLFFSFFLLLLAAFMLAAACCSTSSARDPAQGVAERSWCPCCTKIRKAMHTRVLSKGPLVDLGWQLQGVILSYRTGAFSLPAAILAGCFGVFGEGLAAFGSFAPEQVQELVGPIVG